MEPKKKSAPSPLPLAGEHEKEARKLFPVRILAPVSLAALGAISFSAFAATDDHACSTSRVNESLFDRGAHAAKRAYQRTFGTFVGPTQGTQSAGGGMMTVRNLPRGTTTIPHGARTNGGTAMPSAEDGVEAAAGAAELTPL